MAEKGRGRARLHETRRDRFGGHAGEPGLWGTIVWTHLSVKARGEGSLASGTCRGSLGALFSAIS
jgi:hypothetical protein